MAGQSMKPSERARSYPLLEALIHRRSRRFAAGMKLNGGPLAYDSARPPQPLSTEEEAALAFAACGITGCALAELPYATGNVPEAGGGNIMKQIGRASCRERVYRAEDAETLGSNARLRW